jgi:hypothetical protein
MHGREIVVADADRTNPSLATYFSGVLTPPAADDPIMRKWFAGLCEDQIERRFSALMDLGAADLLLKIITQKMSLVEFLTRHGIQPVAIHLIGPHRDDLAYLRDLEANGLFAPEATILLLNEALVPSYMTSGEAFDVVFNHPVFKAAVARGAQTVWMPRLEAAAGIEARRLTFSAAEAGKTGEDLPPLGPWSQFEITGWLKTMEENFASVAHWLA